MSINWRAVQSRLGITADGIDGPVTYGALFRRLGAMAHVRMGDALARHVSDIRANPDRLARWFGQMGHESGSFRSLVEGMNYTSAARIRATWPSRFPTEQSALPFVRNPEALAERVYGGRMGNVQPGDGFRYRGRGLVHLTGRTNYLTYGDAINQNLVSFPEQAAEPDTAVVLAVAYWQRNGLNALADRRDDMGITRRINGGTHGLADRIARTRRALELLA